MSERQVERVTAELEWTHLSHKNLTEEGIVPQLKQKYPNGFTLQDLIIGGHLTLSIIEKTKMIYMLGKIRREHEFLDRSEQDHPDWEEPLLCEIDGLGNESGLPANLASKAEILMRLYCMHKILVHGIDFMNSTWTFV